MSGKLDYSLHRSHFHPQPELAEPWLRTDRSRNQGMTNDSTSTPFETSVDRRRLADRILTIARHGSAGESGITLIEVLIVVAIIAILLTSVDAAHSNWTGVAKLKRCAVTMEMLASDITTYEIQQRYTLSKELVDWYMPLPENYWYVPNNSDHNKGHGNDLDGCDEENPGKSIQDRECIPMRWLLLCSHDHSAEGVDYVFRIDGMVPQFVPNSSDTDLALLRDATWWLREDPNFDEWWGE